MIDTDELRNDAKTAHFGHTPLEVPGSEMLELLDRLEEAEKEAEKERDILRDRIEVTDEVVRELEKKLSTGMWRVLREENEALRAKMAEMEKQEPIKYECRRKPKNDVTWGLWKQCFKSDTARWGSKTSYEDEHFSYEVRALYALPGAQPAPSAPMDVIVDYLVSIRAHLARRDDAKAQTEIGELLKMIASAPKPEAKP